MAVVLMMHSADASDMLVVAMMLDAPAEALVQGLESSMLFFHSSPVAPAVQRTSAWRQRLWVQGGHCAVLRTRGAAPLLVWPMTGYFSSLVWLWWIFATVCMPGSRPGLIRLGLLLTCFAEATCHSALKWLDVEFFQAWLFSVTAQQYSERTRKCLGAVLAHLSSLILHGMSD